MLTMLKRVIALLLEIGSQEGASGVERFNTLNSRQAQSCIRLRSLKKFTDFFKSGVMGYLQ